MNVFAKFDEIPSMILEVIKETKRYGHKENVKTVYPPTNTVCGGYNEYAVRRAPLKSTVITFSYRKALVTKFDLAEK